MELYRQCKKEGAAKAEFLRRAAQVPGVYVPSLYEVEYHDDGTVKSYTPKEGAPARVEKRVVLDLDKAYYPKSFPVPMIEVVHDRIARRCCGAVSGAAGSARRAFCTGPSGRRASPPSTGSAGTCAPLPGMTRSPCPPFPPATTAT